MADSKGRTWLFIVLLAALSLIQSCSGIKDVRIVSCGVESVSLRGLRSVEANVMLGVDNPSVGMTLSDVRGTVRIGGDEVGTFTVDPVMLNRRSREEYPVTGVFTLSPSVQPLQLVPLLRNADLSKVTADISLKVKIKGGASRRFSLEDVPLSSFFSGSDSLQMPDLPSLFL